MIVEQSSTRAMMTGGRMVLLRSGEIIEDGSPAAIKASEKVRHAYMGTQAEAGGPVL